jgi:hypothetical protein
MRRYLDIFLHQKKSKVNIEEILNNSPSVEGVMVTGIDLFRIIETAGDST